MDLKRVDLNLLVALDALLAERNVTRAAARLSIGQSAMSSTLARLRRLLDDPLLVRNGRTLVATKRAEALQGPLREVLGRIELLLASHQEFDPATTERTFTVLASDFVLMTYLKPILLRITEQAPGIKFSLRDPSGDFAEQLRQGAADLIIAPKEMLPRSTGLRTRELFREPYVCIVDKDHPQVGERLTEEQFSELPYLAWASGAIESPVERQLDRDQVQRRTELTTGLIAAPFVVPGTDMFAIVPERLALWPSVSENVRVFLPPVPMNLLVEQMAWAELNHEDPAHRWLRARLIEESPALQPDAAS